MNKPQIRKKLLEVKKLRKEQLEMIKQLTKPFEDNLALLDRVLKNEVSAKQYIVSSNALDDWFKRFKADEFIDAIEQANPYPKDVFKEKTAADWKKFHAALADKGMVGDGFMGSFGRTVWQNCIDDLRKESGLDGEHK